jgi:hypothetical protein
MDDEWQHCSLSETHSTGGSAVSGEWGYRFIVQADVHNIAQVLDVALGLEYLHSFDPPVIHGDLKGVSMFFVTPEILLTSAYF